MVSIPNIYATDHYKKLIFIPFVFILISFYFIPKIPAGIDLRGGILITTQTNSTVDAEVLKLALTQELGVHDVDVKTAPGTVASTGIEIQIEQNEKLAAAEISLRKFYASYVEFTTADYNAFSYKTALESENVTDADKLRAELADAERVRDAAHAAMLSQTGTIRQNLEPFVGAINVTDGMDAGKMKDALALAYADAKSSYRDRVLGVLRSQMVLTDFTYKDVSPSLSEFFVQKTTEVVIISFVLTALVVLLIFRSIVPSIAVMFGALNDIIFALGAMGLFGIPMTLASLGALLMLIGYSLDTDIMQTIRIMKRTEGTPRERAYGAMKTGLMMSATTMAAFAVLLVLSIVTQIPTYYQIASIAICGLLGDVVATWCTNSVIVLWNVERIAKK